MARGSKKNGQLTEAAATTLDRGEASAKVESNRKPSASEKCQSRAGKESSANDGERVTHISQEEVMGYSAHQRRADSKPTASKSALNKPQWLACFQRLKPKPSPFAEFRDYAKRWGFPKAILAFSVVSLWRVAHWLSIGIALYYMKA